MSPKPPRPFEHLPAALDEDAGEDRGASGLQTAHDLGELGEDLLGDDVDQGEVEMGQRAEGGGGTGEEDRLRAPGRRWAVEAPVLQAMEGGGQVDVEAHRPTGTEEKGGEAEDPGTGADVQNPLPGEVDLLQEGEDEARRLVAAGAEGAPGRQVEEPAAGGDIGGEHRRLPRLPRIDEEAAGDRKGLGLLPPEGEPVGVRLDLPPHRLDPAGAPAVGVDLGRGPLREPGRKEQPAVRGWSRLHPQGAGLEEIGHEGVL